MEPSTNTPSQPRQEKKQRTGLLLVAHGSSAPQSETTIHRFESLIRQTHPANTVRWAFTSDHVRKRLTSKGKKRDSVNKALQRMTLENLTHIDIVPLLVIAGGEYDELLETVQNHIQISTYKHIPSINIFPPLLHAQTDMEILIPVLIGIIPKQRTPDEAVLFMGHGSQHSANKAYAALDIALKCHDKNIHIATLSSTPSLDDVLPKLSKHAKRIWLLPFLAFIGNHALEDMASDSPHSWRSKLIEAGFEPHIQLSSMLEYKPFCELWLAQKPHHIPTRT